MNHLDPDMVKMQFQVAVISVGYKATFYFNKYLGRFISAHLADWFKITNKQVPIGQDIVDWKELFAAAEKCGVKNYFVELNLETFRESEEFIHRL